MRQKASHARSAPTIFSRLSLPVPSDVYETYWRFASERQEIFFQKLEGKSYPWSEDPILQRYKFTNAYRASDRVSQFLIKHVMNRGNQGPGEIFFRTMMFKLFNRISTWELLEANFGEVAWSDYNFERYDSVLSKALAEGERVYSSAYISPFVRQFGYSSKHRNHLKLLELMMQDEVPLQIAESRSMRQAFEILRAYPGIGDFLAYQFITDLNYSEMTDFSEMEFVAAGPGAIDGIRKCFQTLGDMSEADVIHLMVDSQVAECVRLGLRFRSLWGRPLQLIDCQNIFCEVDKYARLKYPHAKGRSGRARIKQLYRPTLQPIKYTYPSKWGLKMNSSYPEGGDPR